jgi:hypothetical protein
MGSSDRPSEPAAPALGPTPPDAVRLDPTGPVTPKPTPRLPHDDEDIAPGLYPVTCVAEFEAAGEWPFPRSGSRIVLGGSRSCDIAIPERGLSGTHCTLERRANSIRVYDMDSTNGTYVGGTRLASSWDIRIGDKFSPYPLTLFLMDEVMQAHRRTLPEILGAGFPPSPDALLTDVVRQASPVLIIGDEGCGQDRLALAIHEMSPRRDHEAIPIVDIPADRAAQSALIRQASKPKTTVVLSIPPKKGNPPLDSQFLSSLYSTSYGVRVIALAASDEDAEHALPKPQLHQSYYIRLQPLAFRSGELARLLDHLLAARGAPELRFADLLEENQDALMRYDWPKNLATLHRVADAIVAHEREGGLRAASRALKISPSSLHELLDRVGLVTRKVGGTERTSLFRP